MVGYLLGGTILMRGLYIVTFDKTIDSFDSSVFRFDME